MAPVKARVAYSGRDALLYRDTGEMFARVPGGAADALTDARLRVLSANNRNVR